jgi:hypothetical protein
MAFTVVGSSSSAVASTTDPESYAIPVPSGTEVGDLLVVGYWGGDGCQITDDRLSTVGRTGLASPYSSGAWGIATDLSDVTLDMTSFAGITVTYPGLVTVLALRGVGEPDDTGAQQFVEYDDTDDMYARFTGSGYDQAVMFVCDVNSSVFTEVGTSAWTDQGEVNVLDGGDPGLYYSLRGFTWTGGEPDPLVVGDAGGNEARSLFLVRWGVAAPARHYLRQRQSPNTSIRNGIQSSLRQRQTFQ